MREWVFVPTDSVDERRITLGKIAMVFVASLPDTPAKSNKIIVAAKRPAIKRTGDSKKIVKKTKTSTPVKKKSKGN